LADETISIDIQHIEDLTQTATPDGHLLKLLCRKLSITIGVLKKANVPALPVPWQSCLLYSWIYT
jgi:hypothetical protein